MKLRLAFAYRDHLCLYILEAALPPPLCHLHVLIDAARAALFGLGLFFFFEQGRVMACTNKTFEKNYNANMSVQIICFTEKISNNSHYYEVEMVKNKNIM